MSYKTHEAMADTDTNTESLRVGVNSAKDSKSLVVP